MRLTVELITPDAPPERLEEVLYLKCVTPNGAIQFLKGHAPLIGELAEPDVAVKLLDGSTRSYRFGNGIVSVSKDLVTVIGTSLVRED